MAKRRRAKTTAYDAAREVRTLSTEPRIRARQRPIGSLSETVNEFRKTENLRMPNDRFDRLMLVKCPKCQNQYTRLLIENCPNCGIPNPEFRDIWKKTRKTTSP